MNEMAYFELFGRISDKYVTEALIPVVIPAPATPKGFKQTPFGRFLASPAFIAVVGGIVAAAVAVAIGFGIAGQGKNPDTDTQTPPNETLWESSESTDGTETESSADTDKDHPYIERKNYDREIGIIYGKDLMGEGFTYLPEDMVFAGATALNADVFERIQKVEDYLGVQIGFIEEEDDGTVLNTVGKMSGVWDDDNYFVIASGRVMAWLGNGGTYMAPWDTLDAINTEADYWDTELMRTHTQGGHSYIAYNSFIPPNAYAIAYNKSLYATAPTQRDLYSLVESGDWTVETMMSVLNETSSINGRLAIRDHGSAGAYLSSVGFRVLDTVETDTGYTQSSNMAEREESLKPLYLRALELVSDEMTLRVAIDNDRIPFIEDGEVLMDTRLTRDLAAKAYGKPIGVLPLPKYDKAQSEYLSLHVNAYMGLWCNEENRQMCGEVAELLAYFSRNAYEDYNRAVMGVYGKDGSGVQRDLAMLRIIHNTTHDMGITYPGLNIFLIQPLLDGQSEIASGEATQIKNIIRSLTKETGW